jgi:transmembrane 9 superfamily member 2/4
MASARSGADRSPSRMFRVLFVLAFAVLAVPAASFYLPGIAPMDYPQGSKLDVMANKLTSSKNQLPYDYYWLPFCGSEEVKQHRSKPVNLGQLLMGERMKPIDYALKMKEPQSCAVLCTKTFNAADLKRFTQRISQDYVVRLNLDNMPVVMKVRTVGGRLTYHFGYRVGFQQQESKKLLINNHLKFTILYNEPPKTRGTSFNDLELDTSEGTGYRVVGFEVEAFSVNHKSGNAAELKNSSCPVSTESSPQILSENTPITFTYDVDYIMSPTRWATRWDPLLSVNPELKQIQWFSIVNSLMITLFLTTLVGTVLMRTVLRDFVRYNQLEDEDEADDVSGWKLVHGDVFRAPRLLPLLAVCVGSGTQTLCMTTVTLAFALLGFLSPANRGGLLTSMLSLWVLASSVNGYSSARIYSAFEASGSNRRLVTMGSAFIFPGLSFGVFFMLNLCVWMSGSSGAVPFVTLLLLLFMWFGVSVPLVFTGAYIGYKRKSITFPVRTNQIPRQIPAAPLNVPQWVYIMLAGILPFGTVFMELVFLLNAVAQSQILYVFGMFTIVFLILLVTCIEVSIVFTYLTLSNEQWTWNWQAFLTSASSGLYMFAYTQYYLFSQPAFGTVSLVSMALYTSYSLIVSSAFSLLTGCVGYYGSFWFVRKIYSNIHVS